MTECRDYFSLKEFMLSENVLEHLIRKTSLREHLISTAWLDLSVESKLQVIEALIGLGGPSGLPDWLIYLAIQDTSPIVQYWALKEAYLKKPKPDHPDEPSMEFYQFALASQEPLVKSLAAKVGMFDFKHLTDAPQLSRLALIRNGDSKSFGAFIDWLDEAFENGVPDVELGECCNEFLNLESVKEELGTNFFEDGFDAHTAGKGIEKAWMLMKKADKYLLSSLLYRIPTSLGLKTIKVETLCDMPERVLSAYPYWTAPSEEIEQVVELMRSKPERFPAEAIKSLSYVDSGSFPSDDELAVQIAYSSPARSKVLLDSILKLQNDISILRNHVDVISKKRGIFF
jgi:hypothetical protein